MSAELAPPTPGQCPYCGSTDLSYKNRVGQWECDRCQERFVSDAPRRLPDTALRPMRIFFSYGHDQHQELVLLFKRDLEQRGHEVWFDAKDIGVWDDWRGKITRGIDSSEMAVAFMSNHALRDPGVCRHEIDIAMNRFGTVYPVIVEAAIEDDIPVTIRHLQWPDLRQWQAIRDGQIKNEDWARWYQERLIELIHKIEGEASHFSEETRVLHQVLRPASFEAEVAQHVPGFVGREWVFDAYEIWLNEQPQSRLFWIEAGPGVGKSAIAANLVARKRSAIVASWFCVDGSATLRSPDEAIRSLAYQWALRWEDYRVALLRQLQLSPRLPDDCVRNIALNLNKQNSEDLFRILLVEPLSGLIWREHKLVVVIDALDQATDEAGNNALADFLSTRLASLPNWISFVVTSRPEYAIQNRLQGFRPTPLNGKDPRNLDDLNQWYKANLGRHPALAALPDSEQQSHQERLIALSEGMILYLKMVEEGFRERSLEVAGLENLSAGLPGLFQRYYTSFSKRFGADYETAVQPLLRLLVATDDPVPEDLIRAILGWDSEQLLSARNRLGSYCIETAVGLRLFHKTLGEWLRGRSSGDFHVDSAIGRQNISGILLREVQEKAAYAISWRPQVRGWLPSWLHSINQGDTYKALSALGSVLSEWGDVMIALDLYQQALARARQLGSDSQIAVLLNNLGTVYSKLGGTANQQRAILYFEECLALMEPLNADGWHLMIVVAALTGLGGAYAELGGTENLKRAIRYNEKGLEVTRKFYPDDGHSDIAASLNNLGLIYYELGGTVNRQRAIKYHEESLALRRKLFPDGTHPDIAASLNALGITCKKSGDKESLTLAIQYLEESQAIIRKLYPDGLHPAIAESSHNLGSVYNELGGTENQLRAIRHYDESIALTYRFYPDGRHPNIAKSMNNLGADFKALGGPNNITLAIRYYKDSLTLSLKLYPDRHHAVIANILNELGVTYMDLGGTENWQQAIQYFEDSLKTLLKLYPDCRHPDIASGLGSLSFARLFVGSYAEALRDARDALELIPDEHWVHVNQAHALLLMGKEEEAFSLYAKYRDLQLNDSQSFRDSVLEDFATFRTSGIDCPGFATVEAMYAGRN